MKINADFTLPKYIAMLLEMLHSAGFEAYVVGGCVRDLFCGKAPDDYDITTNALPEQTKAVFDGHYKTIDTGIKHGTVTVVCPENNVEITTYRIDGEYRDSRRPQSVEFTPDLVCDLKRRDFTMNALVFSPNDGVCDFFGGVGDIQRKTIKCIGNPHERFSEDALRILRAIRFSAVLGFDIEQDTSNAVHSEKHLLANISAERIYSELCKLLSSRFAETTRKILLEYSDVFEQIFGDIPTNSEYEAICQKASFVRPQDDLRTVYFLSAISRFDCENAKRCVLRLKPSNEFKKRVNAVCEAYKVAIDAKDEVSAKMLVRKYGFDYAEDVAKILFDTKENTGLCELLAKIKTDGSCVKISDLAVGGDEIRSLGIPPKQIGLVLNDVLTEIIYARLANCQDDITAYVTKKYT